MRLVRFGLVGLLVLAFASPLFAATGTTTKSASTKSTSTAKMTPEEMAKEALAKWKTKLKLTDDQVPQFESVMTESYKKMADAKTAAAGDHAKMKASMETIMKDREEDLGKVLTPDQMKIYKENVSKMASSAKKHMAAKTTTTSK